MAKFKEWEKTEIKTSDGKKQAITPLILSVSRSTDVPAFFTEWFLNRLKEGYARWINPFNQQPQYISFEKAKAAVFWSKNPQPLLDRLDELDNYGIGYYFQFTLCDYEKEGLEPNVPPMEKRIETFKKLSQKLGKEKVIWRFDPFLLGDGLKIEDLLEKVKRVGDRLNPFTEKLVISFIDIDCYKKVKNNLQRHGNFRELNLSEKNEMALQLKEMNREWNLEISTCAEGIDLDKFDIKPNRCIDGSLLAKLFPEKKELMEFLGVQKSLFSSLGSDFSEDDLKDKGQREACGCIVSKDIGAYNTCPHLCRYCYANSTKGIVLKNFKNHSSSQPGITKPGLI